MQVREIMSHNVKQISSTATIGEAAECMREYDVGALPVTQDRKTVGVITDRDIVIRAIAADMDPRITPVKEAMTPELVCCEEYDRIEDAARIMEDRQVRRLLVVDSADRVVGILSVSDLAMKTGNEHLAYEVIERICEPFHNA
jgi:CBS domain-containing protein